MGLEHRIATPDDPPAADGGEPFEDPLLRRVVAFVRGIGIPVRPAPLPYITFMPGIDLRAGGLLIDEPRLMAPCDLLHEAGHLAAKAPDERGRDPFVATGAEEMCALAWSYAAVRHLGIDVELLYHRMANGPLHEALLENFAEGRYVGLPLLQQWGMTIEPRLARPDGPPPFPHMLRWLR